MMSGMRAMKNTRYYYYEITSIEAEIVQLESDKKYFWRQATSIFISFKKCEMWAKAWNLAQYKIEVLREARDKILDKLQLGNESKAVEDKL